jgi:hypothetical protein
MAKYKLIFKKKYNKITIPIHYLLLQIHQAIQMKGQISQEVLHHIVNKMIDSKIRNILIKKGKIKCKIKKLEKEDY